MDWVLVDWLSGWIDVVELVSFMNIRLLVCLYEKPNAAFKKPVVQMFESYVPSVSSAKGLAVHNIWSQDDMC